MRASLAPCAVFLDNVAFADSNGVKPSRSDPRSWVQPRLLKVPVIPEALEVGLGTVLGLSDSQVLWMFGADSYASRVRVVANAPANRRLRSA